MYIRSTVHHSVLCWRKLPLMCVVCVSVLVTGIVLYVYTADYVYR